MIHGLPIAGQALGLGLAPELYRGTERAGELLTVTDRSGGGWRPVGTLVIDGPRGAIVSAVSLTPSMLRTLARRAERLADFLDARAAGHRGPCLCTAWMHGLEPCRWNAWPDSDLCRDCWTPERGQQDHPR